MAVNANKGLRIDAEIKRILGQSLQLSRLAKPAPDRLLPPREHKKLVKRLNNLDSIIKKLTKMFG